jgi:hypothetical protein
MIVEKGEESEWVTWGQEKGSERVVGDWGKK